MLVQRNLAKVEGGRLVRGAEPREFTNAKRSLLSFNAGIAQLVERNLAKVVAGRGASRVHEREAFAVKF